MRPFLTFALAMMPTLSVACPTAADLTQGGILFTAESGDTELFSTLSDGVVQALYTATDGAQSRVLLGRGVYLLEYTEVQNGIPNYFERVAYGFPISPEKLPLPQTDDNYEVAVAVWDYGELHREDQVYNFGPVETIDMAGCTLERMKVTVSYHNEDQTVDDIHYFPKLGISYLAGSSYGVGEDRVTDVYPFVSVAAN